MMMAVLLCFGIVPSNAFAAEYEYDGYISMIDYNGRGYSLSSSLPAPFGGYSTDKFTELRINDLTAFRTAYCIQLGVATHTGIGYDQSDDYAALTTEQKAMINTALTLGYNVETGTKYGGSAMDEYIATQILIWLIAHGQLGTGYENQIVNEITANSPAAKTIFQKLRENVVTYHTVPSFATDNPSAVGAYTHDLKYNEDTGKNETTLVDENNVLKDFSVSYPGVDFSISGNKLHVSTDKKEFGTITAEKELPSSIPGVVTGGTKYWLRDEYQNVVTFDVKGSAEPVKCYFSLEIKAGTLQLVKTSEDGEVSGIPFHISGNGIEKDVVTGPDGTIRVDNLQAGTYTVTERAPDKYVQPESKQVTIYPGQTSSVSFSNLLKKFTVKLDKVDSETEEAQGDSSLDGALYGMFKGENLLDTYTTANGGKFTTKEYPCGSDYTIREITPSEGYLLDETIYPVGAEPGNFTLENNSIPMTATEDVILGSIAITKHTDKPAESSDSDQIEQPEEGAQFQIYLASAGSYENAKETERDLLTTDSYGFARSKDLPYGLYVVHQTKGAQGQKFVPDFSVFISEHGKTYYFILNNPTFTSLIRFEKKDAESGKIIPLAGTAVKIRNADTGEWVVQHINYPSPIDIDTFVTDSTGTLMLPEPLPFGNYELYEQQSPWGYVLDKEPVPFVVDGSQDVVTVEKYNIPQKGTITVSKEGEVFKSVAESGGMYQPQYEVQGQPGAVYEITALEDVVTPDGTVHLKAGELAATLTTGSDGTATSEPLYLGRYQVKEITAPDGMVIDPEPKEVVLSYAGQEVEITSASIGFVNERQKVEISLKKLLEQDETFSLGMNEEWKNITFGLFAAEQLTASDGTSIPADGLMETIGIDENGNAVFTTDIPCGASLYVQEIGTDDHYILSDKKSPVVFEYAGQDVAKVEIEANDGVVQEAQCRGLSHEEFHSKVEYIVAHGIASTVNEERVLIGSAHFIFEDEGVTVPLNEQERFDRLPEEYSHLYLAIGRELAAVICISDPLRREAKEVLTALRALGIQKTVMLTGDSYRTASTVANRLGVDAFCAEVLPADKAKFVADLRQKGHIVLMVGDGINDSPALSEADAGIAISDGAAIAREIADITIAADSLWELVKLRRIAMALMERIHSNYRFVIGFNGTLIGLGLAGILPPAASAALHNLSTLGVSLRSMSALPEPKQDNDRCI